MSMVGGCLGVDKRWREGRESLIPPLYSQIRMKKECVNDA